MLGRGKGAEEQVLTGPKGERARRTHKRHNAERGDRAEEARQAAQERGRRIGGGRRLAGGAGKEIYRAAGEPWRRCAETRKCRRPFNVGPCSVLAVPRIAVRPGGAAVGGGP